MAREPQYDDQVYDVVVGHWMNFWQPPSIQYVVDNTGLSSKSTVRAALLRLQRKGLMRIIKGKAVPAGVEIRIRREYEPEKS